MKNGLLRFYLIFMVMCLALFSCENHEISNFNSGTSENNLQRRPDERRPIEPNGAPEESQKSKRSPKRYYSRSKNLC